MVIDLQNSKLAMKDLWTFVPQLKEQTSSLSPDATLYIDAKITGKVSDLNFERLSLKGLSGTNINAKGVIKGLPDPKKVYADLVINKLQTSRKDILAFVPKNSIPSNITLPESIAASGFVKGGMNNLNTDLAVNTTLGSARANGTLVNITDKNRAKYNMALSIRGLMLGTLMKNPKLGSLTADFKVKGNGYNPETANATFDGIISGITLNNYNYRNLKASGSIANKNFKVNADIHDPNIDVTMLASGTFNGKLPAIHLNATVDSIKTLALHLTQQSIIYHGQIDGDFTNINPDSLAGNLSVTHSVLVNNGQRITLDSLQVIADNTTGNQSLTLKTDFLSASIKGQYKLTQLADVFQQAIDPYFSLTAVKNTQKVDFYHFTINAGIVDNPALRAFLPNLTQLKPINLSGTFASDSGWNLAIKSPHIVYGTSDINELNFNAGTKNGALIFNTSLKQFKSGTSLSIYATTLNGTLQNNDLDFTLNIKDKNFKNKYRLSGNLNQPTLNNYAFSLKPDSLLLNYDQWSINADNKIQYFNKDINAHNFVLSQKGQELSIHSTAPSPIVPCRLISKISP